MRYELEILEKIMFYDANGFMTSFPLYVYRMKDMVNRKALETAVDIAIKCHPLFGCRLAEDAGGPFMETNSEKPVIPDLDPDSEYFYGNEANNYYPWTVGINGKEIIYTGYHGFADGMGATSFMRTVLYYYFKEQGTECDPGKAVTLDQLTPEILEKDTECTVRKNGGEDFPSLIRQNEKAPSVFPDELLEEDDERFTVRNLSISLEDIRKKSAEYEVSQFAVMTTYLAQAVSSVLPGEDNVVLFNIVADMRSALNSTTTHNCVMTVPVVFSQNELKDKPEGLLCTMFRSRLDVGYNREEALHNCFNSSQMEKQIGGSKEYLAGTATQITQMFGFELPVASITYTHLTHTGFSEDMFGLMEDAYICYAGYKKRGKQAIRAINAVTTDRSVNLMMIDGTKDELILKALEKRLSDAGISFKVSTLDKYKGILYRRENK